MSGQARVVNVYDEGAMVGTSLRGGHGQGFIIDVDGQRVLFDTGLRGRYLLHNLRVLKIKPESIDLVILSHGHRDHCGGLPALLDEREEPLPVIAHPLIWESRAKGPGLPIINIGFPRLNAAQREKMQLREVEGWNRISEHLQVTGSIADRRDIQALGRNLYRHRDGKWGKDRFDDEISLVIESKNGPVLITGCGHPGITNILRHVVNHYGKDVHAVIGGAHMESFRKREVERVAEIIIDEFETPQLYLNHCTGPNGIMRMREHLGLDGVRDCFVGTELLFPL